MYKNTIEAIIFIKGGEIMVAIDPPAIAPMRLANIKAVEAPMKTANGLLEDPLKVKVAN